MSKSKYQTIPKKTTHQKKKNYQKKPQAGELCLMFGMEEKNIFLPLSSDSNTLHGVKL